jgi:hypothetical protein
MKTYFPTFKGNYSANCSCSISSLVRTPLRQWHSANNRDIKTSAGVLPGTLKVQQKKYNVEDFVVDSIWLRDLNTQQTKLNIAVKIIFPESVNGSDS